MNVVMGMITDEDVKAETYISTCAMFHHFPEFQSRLLLHQGGFGNLAGTRNRLTRAFLESDAEWLLVVDSDMTWFPDDWARLRDSALTNDATFVSGLYFIAHEPPEPNAFVFNKKDGKWYAPNITEDSEELIRVHTVGSGFSLIHREVYEKTADRDSDHEWYEHGRRGPTGATLSEDIAFCGRVGQFGIPIHLNTKVRIGHVKPKVIGWKEYRDATQE